MIKKLILLSLVALNSFGLELETVQPDNQIVVKNVWEKEPGDKFLVLEFFYTLCGPCYENIKYLPTIQKELGPEVTIKLVGVDYVKQDLLDYINENRSIFIVDAILDTSHLLSEPLQIKPLPATLVFDENGKEIHRHIGGIGPNALRQLKRAIKR